MRYLSKKETARLIGIHPRTLDRWHRLGLTLVRCKHGPYVAYLEDDVWAWIDNGYDDAEVDSILM